MENLSKRELRKREIKKTIIETAEILFIENGYKGTSMNKISEESTYTKRTIYKYFVSKEDLFFAVLLVRVKELYEFIMMNISKAKNGLKELDAALNSLYYLYNQFSPAVPLLSMFESARKKETSKTTPYKENFFKYINEIFVNINNIYINGINDGSMRNDIDPFTLTYSSVFSFIGFLGIMHTIGHEFFKNQGVDEEAFMKSTIKLQLDSVKKQNS